MRQTEVDGVPTLLAPTAGPMRAGLVFRVGRADEQLSSTGITHLVEHLALHRQGLADYHYNGATGITATHFYTQGTPGDVVTFLNGVCAALHHLPLDRLSLEKRVIEAEAASRPPAVNESMPLWRHGARDFGLPSYPEWGIRRVAEEEVAAWTQQWFTRDNVALWIAGADVPTGLRLVLPRGERRPLPQESSALPVTPAYFNGSADTVVMDAPVPRSAPSKIYARLLQRELFRELRQDHGLSYIAAASYDAVGGPQATVTAVANSLPDRQHEVVAGFVRVVKQLANQPPEKAALDAVRGLETEALRHPEYDADRLPSCCLDLLIGSPRRSVAELIDALDRSTAEDVHAAAASAHAAALLMVPGGHALESHGFEAAPSFSRFAVTGTRYRSREHHEVALVLGSDGVSVVTPRGPVTVLFEQCAGLLAWPDGARQLFGHDGINVRVEPTLFALDQTVLDTLDRAVEASRTIAMPAREPDEIPKPAAKPRRTRLRKSQLSAKARLHELATGQHGTVRGLVAAVAVLGGIGLILVGVGSGHPFAVMIAMVFGCAVWRAQQGPGN